MVYCDFHCHSLGSPDSLISMKDIRKRRQETGLDRICITDHNSIEYALQLQKNDPEHIIVGEEVMTTQGELLGYYVKERIPGGLSPSAAIDRLRAQDAVISVSHPFDMRRFGWQVEVLESILPYVDAIEVFNGRCGKTEINSAAKEFADKMGAAGTAGSDAHTPGEIGAACLELPYFDDAASLKKALRRARIIGRLSSPIVHAGSRLAVLIKRVSRK